MLAVCVRHGPNQKEWCQLCSPQRDVDVQGGMQYRWCLLDSSFDHCMLSNHLQWLKCVRAGCFCRTSQLNLFNLAQCSLPSPNGDACSIKPEACSDLPVDLTRATDTGCNFGSWRLHTGSSCCYSNYTSDAVDEGGQTYVKFGAQRSNRAVLCSATTRSRPAHPSVFHKPVIDFAETTVTSSPSAGADAAGSASLTKPMHSWNDDVLTGISARVLPFQLNLKYA